LASGEAVAPDVGCAHKHAIKVESGSVFLKIRIEERGARKE
jgi:nitrite reductase (NADH) small subunit